MLRASINSLASLATLATCLLGATAYADNHALVLKADGNADAKTKKQIDAAVLKLAKGTVDGVAPGDISFADAAAAVGCNPSAPTCKDDVLGMLSVDEIIETTVNRKPGGLEVFVRRAGKTGTPREATAKVTDAQDALLEPQLASVFGAATTPPPPVVDTPPPVVDTPPPVVDTPPPITDTPPVVTTQPQPQPLPQPQPVDDQHGNRLKVAGMIGGGALVVLGFVMWGQASGTQNDIDAAPSRTKADLIHIQDLEKQGDSQAGFGNLLFIGGLVLGGVSTYFYIRDRQHRNDPVARIIPTVTPHGAGLALTGVLP